MTTPSASPTPAALTALQAALAAEHAAVYGYGVVGGHLTGSRLTEARAAYTAHQAHRDALRRQVTALHGTPVAAAPGYRLPFAVTGPDSAVRLAALLEDRLTAVHADLVAAATGTLRRSAADALREAAVRAARWRGLTASVPAFPGLPERAPAARPATAATAPSATP